MKRSTTIIAMIAAVMLVAGPASAAGSWTANPGTSVENGVITLDTTDPGQTPAGTSLENTDVDTPVAEGDTITFEYRILTEDTSCGGGQPRVFIQGGAFNTFDGNPDQCGQDADGDGWFLVTYTLPSGTSGTAGYSGVVFDNPSDRGIAQVRNVTIAGDPIFPSNKDECKKGGWEDAGYRNQGQCVSSFAKK